jgi:hypothetical protein
MEKLDFSLRKEIEIVSKETLGLNLTDEQIDEVLDEMTQYDTFLNIVSLFVYKGIQDMAKFQNIQLDEEKMEHQLSACRQGIRYEDL